MLNKILRILQILGIVVVCIMLVLAVFQKFLPKEKSILGYRTFVIISKSMEPNYKIGDVILVKQTEPENLKINDVVTYKGLSGDFSNKIITHKVVNILTEDDRYIFYTKGTNNMAIDPAVYEEQLYGKVVYKFYFLSLVSKILRNTFGFVFFVVIPLVILFVREVQELRSEIKERRS